MSDYDQHKRYPPRRARRGPQPVPEGEFPADYQQPASREGAYYADGVDMTAQRFDNDPALADQLPPVGQGVGQEPGYSEAVPGYAGVDYQQPQYSQPGADGTAYPQDQGGFVSAPPGEYEQTGATAGLPPDYDSEYQTPAHYVPEEPAAAPAPAPQPAARPGHAARAGQPARPRHPRAKTASKGKRAAVLIAIVLAVIAVAAIALFSLGGLDTLLHGGKDYQGKGKGQVTVVIPKGATGRDIAAILQKKDVVASAGAFERAFKSNSLSQGVQPGTYKLHKQMASAEALALLLDPASKADLRVTVPEGFTVAQIKQRLVSVGGFAPDKVDAALKDTQALGLPQAAKGNLEGWLAPDSYAIGEADDPATVLKKMVSLQLKRLDQVGVPQDARETVLVKASILEREVNQKQYYPKVARVIDNRLQDNPETHGLLQMDSTVLFGLGKVGGIPTKDQLKQDTPYNTYLHKGLPPGPIGTPGLEAIKGTINLEPGSWLYYVTVDLKSGETKFATTHDEHKQNIAQLRQYCKANPGVC